LRDERIDDFHGLESSVIGIALHNSQ
jgi:hypothetical protein